MELQNIAFFTILHFIMFIVLYSFLQKIKSTKFIILKMMELKQDMHL